MPALRKLKPPGPAKAPPADVPLPAGPTEQDPVDEGLRTVMLRAAIVVLDDFDGVPVTVTQSPAASELTDSVTVFENCVEVVQLTVVWPVLGFCTSMLDAWSAATLPVATPGAFGERRCGSGDRTDRRGGHQRRRAGAPGIAPSAGDSCFGWSVSACGVSLSWFCRYSFRRASMGARWAARLAGYTPNAIPMAERDDQCSGHGRRADRDRIADHAGQEGRPDDPEERAECARRSGPARRPRRGTGGGSRRGVAPSALRSPISRMRSVTETSMMFMTPMPPTSSEMPATPPSRIVSVRSTDVAVEISDCSEVIVKSAFGRGRDPVELQEKVVRLLVGGCQVCRRTGLHRDGADRVACRPAEDALGARRDRDDDEVVGVASMLDDEEDDRWR